MLCAPDFKRPHLVFRLCLSSERYDGNMFCPFVSLKNGNRGPSVHHGHLHIHEDEIWNGLDCFVNSLLPIFRYDQFGAEATPLQYERDQVSIVLVVFRQQNLFTHMHIPFSGQMQTTVRSLETISSMKRHN